MASIHYAFLLDENAMHLKNFFPAGRAKTVVDFGMVGDSDDAVLAKAYETKRILVTSNRDDFHKRFIAFAAQGGKGKCTDLYGLVLFNGERSAQQKHFPVQRIERRFGRLPNERRALGWIDVSDLNLLVRVTSESVEVQKLPRCPFCMTLN